MSFESKEIPPFSMPVNLGSEDKKELEKEIMDEIVQRHYCSVIAKVNSVLENVKNKYTQKKESPEGLTTGT